MSSWRLALVISIVALVPMSGGCSLPEGDQSSPTQLHYLWVKVRAAGDADRMWDLLHPDVRAEFERWLTAEKRTVNEIKTAYPKEDAVKALEVIGGSKRGELDAPKSLFKLFVRPTPDAPGSLGEVAAHVKSEDLSADGATATIRTYGGDEVVFQKGGDGQWYATLAPDELVRLKTARANAERNLERVKANLQKLGRNKP
jgi:hypothetical protein